MVAAQVELGNGGDDRHQDDSEESAAVDDFEDDAEAPGEAGGDQDGEDKEDVAADGGAGLPLVRGEVGQ